MNHETGLEKVIGQVATFKMPTAATGKGVYELKVMRLRFSSEGGFSMFFFLWGGAWGGLGTGR